MFIQGFLKTAATLVTMTPEEYYDIVGEKDPLVGALVGAGAGAGAAALRAKKGSRAAAALAGAATGAAAGGAGGYASGKALRKYQSNRVRRLAGELHLRTTPGKQSGHGHK